MNFPFLDRDVHRSTSYRVYISQLIRFARVSSHVADFSARNKSLTAKLLQQGNRYHKLRKTFSKFYRRHYELVSKFNVGLKTLLHQGLSVFFSFAPVFQWCCSTPQRSPGVGRNTFLSSPHLCFIIVFICDFFFPMMIH